MPKRKRGPQLSAAPSAAPSGPGIRGRWRMTRMSTWDNEFMDAEEPAFIEFRPGGRGTFHFGYVHCEIDWRPEPRQGRPGAAFTFEGNDEMDPTSGRGWAAVRIDGALVGRLRFYRGDDSDFSATRIQG